MKDQLNKLASGAAGAVLFLVGCAMAGIGLTVILLLAIFGMAAFGLAILASPFVSLAQEPKGDEPTDHSAQTAA